MQKRYSHKFRRSRNTLGRPEEIKPLLEHFLQSLGKPEQAMLLPLWQHWEMVMGDYIASLAWPLGYKNGVLYVGGEDAMSVQELSFMSLEMLERANAFMDKDFFKEVRVGLRLDKVPLHETVKRKIPKPSPLILKGAALSGKYLKDMPADSPVARCYARFVAKSQEK